MARPLLTIGFLVDTLAEDYQRRIFVGVCAEAARLNVNVRCFVGGVLSTTGAVTQRNRIYETASSSHLDGVVVAAGPLSNLTGPTGLAQFVSGFAPLPVCSVGIELPGLDSVTVDNAAGVREALSHLIEEAGRRRIAFIRGPEGNREAEERYRVYREVLASNRLMLDPDLITRGDFEAASGKAAVATLLDERHIGFDAILAASDLMALGAMNALIERGVAVPARVGVVGFDDIDAARFATSPLTTVRQPLAELGKRALASVLRQIYNTEGEQSVVLPARLVKRQSSGSLTQRASSPPRAGAPLTENHAPHPSIAKDRFVSALQAAPGFDGLDPDWTEQLCATLLADSLGRRSGLVQRVTFLGYVEHLLLRLAERGGDVSRFHQVLTQMREHFLIALQHNPQQRELAESLWHEARILTGSIAERVQVQQRLHTEHFRRAVSDIGAELLRVSSWEQLAATLGARLPLLGIQAGALCTFEANGMAQLRVACDGGFSLECSPVKFSARELLPPNVLGLERRRTLVIETLYVREQALGYALFEMGPVETECYAALRDYLTGAVRGLLGVPPAHAPS